MMDTRPDVVRSAHRRRRRLVRAAMAAAVALPVLGTGGSPTAGAWNEAGDDPVIAWNAVAGDAALASCIAPANDPLHESRMYAMTHVAIHDALNSIERRAQEYAFRASPLRPTVSPAAAVAAAAHDALVPVLHDLPDIFPPECIAAGVAVVEDAYTAELADIPDGQAKEDGIALGQASAAAILARRADDGSDTLMVDPNYPQGDEPGEYRFTPGTPFAFAPGWGAVTPFVLRSSTEFGAPRPYRVNSRSYTGDFNDVKSLGGDGIVTPSARTAEQTEIALFWLESSPLLWNRMARTVATSQGLDTWENARLFGLLNLAMADGYIGTFEDKYDYNFWRPVTAIQLAADDGNPNTAPDPTWTPLVTTPPIPDHDSGHAVEGAAAAQVFRRFFRTDDISFEVCSLTLPEGQQCDDAAPVFRSFDSFSAAAAENGESRVLVGFHFRNAVDDGLDHGKRIAERAVARYLRTVS